ncbi:hypothetical protein IW262DRAFT_1465894 [Armillaria fumosa]|nr:hypothetical protein IW262DRAFT_1465894 [Armillaria fumosa]
MHNRLPDALGYIAETLVIWDYLISIDDEVGADRPVSYTTDEPLLGHCVLGTYVSVLSTLKDWGSLKRWTQSSKRTWIKFLFFVASLDTTITKLFNIFIESLPWHRPSNMGYVQYVKSRIVTFHLLNYQLPKSFDTISFTTYAELVSLSFDPSLWKDACYLFIDPESIIYVGIQLVVMNIIMVVRAWVIMRKRHHVLLTLFGLLTISASTVIGVLPMHDRTNYFYFIPNVLFEVAIFAVVAYHEIGYLRNSKALESSYAGVSQPMIRPIMQLMFEDSILYFVIIIGVLIIVPFLTNTMPLCLSVASITVTRMLLRLRKQALFDSGGPTSDQEELSTFTVRAVSGGMNSSSETGEDRSS